MGRGMGLWEEGSFERDAKALGGWMWAVGELRKEGSRRSAKSLGSFDREAPG